MNENNIADQNGLEKSKLLLKSLDFFSIFTDEELNSFLEISEIKKYNAHQHIIRENTKGDFFYVIIRGTVNIIIKGRNDVKRTVTTLRKGDCFGEIAVILDQPRSASILAISDCYVSKIDGKGIEKLSLEIREKLFRQFSISLSKRLLRSSGK